MIREPYRLTSGSKASTEPERARSIAVRSSSCGVIARCVMALSRPFCPSLRFDTAERLWFPLFPRFSWYIRLILGIFENSYAVSAGSFGHHPINNVSRAPVGGVRAGDTYGRQAADTGRAPGDPA